MSKEVYNIDDLYLYSRCPRLYWNKHNLSPLHKDEMGRIIRICISKTLSKTPDAKQLINWRRVLGWANKEVFKNIDVTNKNSLLSAKKRIGPILDVLYTWYHKYYRPLSIGGVSDIYIEVQSNLNFKISGRVPIVSLGEPISIVNIDNYIISPFEMLRDIKSHFRAYLLSKSLDVDSIIIDYYKYGSSGALTNQKKTIQLDDLERVETYIYSLVSALKNKVNYPVFTAGCVKCPLYKQCIL